MAVQVPASRIREKSLSIKAVPPAEKETICQQMPSKWYIPYLQSPSLSAPNQKILSLIMACLPIRNMTHIFKMFFTLTGVLRSVLVPWQDLGLLVTRIFLTKKKNPIVYYKEKRITTAYC